MRPNVGVMTENVGCSVVPLSLPELLLADGGDEFLEVERFEVCYVLEIAGA